MAKLKYKFTNDTLFKMLFVEYPGLLKILVAVLLGIPIESITEFTITNSEIPPEVLKGKFCRLDINMKVDGRRVDLEVQVSDEGDYPERSLYYWAREYSSALPEGGAYSDLPRTVVISIVAFSMFRCSEYHSEFRAMEATRHTLLTDRLSLHYFELPKLPKEVAGLNGRELWLALFNAGTEEELAEIESLGVPEMTQAITAYRAVTVTDQFKELERLRSLAQSNEASALRHARDVAIAEADEKWQGVVSEKDAALAEKDSALAEKDSALAEKDAAFAEALAEKDSVLAEKDATLDKQAALIAELRKRLGEF